MITRAGFIFIPYMYFLNFFFKIFILQELFYWLLYLPVYNARPCIMRTPILDCTLKKKKGKKTDRRKQRKCLRKNSVKRSWFGNTLKTTTRSSLQKCHSMHQPRNEQFFRWTLLAVSLCKIMDTVRYPLHPAPRLVEEHYGLENWGQSARN